MKTMKTLASALCALSLVLFTGCNKDDDGSNGGSQDDVTYSVTYSVTEISADFFACGSFNVYYADKDGVTQTKELVSADDVPFSVTVSNLSEDGKIYFDMIYGKNSTLNLDDRQYTFTQRAYYTIVSSDAEFSAPFTYIEATNTYGYSSVDTFLTAIVDRDIEVDTTVKDKL